MSQIFPFFERVVDPSKCGIVNPDNPKIGVTFARSSAVDRDKTKLEINRRNPDRPDSNLLRSKRPRLKNQMSCSFPPFLQVQDLVQASLATCVHMF